MKPKQSNEMIKLNNVAFIMTQKAYIEGIMISDLEDYVVLKLGTIESIHDVDRSLIEKSIEVLDKIIKIVSVEDEKSTKVNYYFRKLKHFYKHRDLDGFDNYKKPKETGLSSIEYNKLLVSKRKKAESINENTEDLAPINYDWEILKKSKTLSEAFIMEHHKNLIEYTDETYETFKSFIKRQVVIPALRVTKYKLIDFSLNNLKETLWDTFQEDRGAFVLYPNKNAFLSGILEYNIPKSIIKGPFLGDAKLGVTYVKDKFVITQPLKRIYNLKRFYQSDGTSLIKSFKIENVKEIKQLTNVFIVEFHDGRLESVPYNGDGFIRKTETSFQLVERYRRLVVKESKPTITKILKNNNLNKKENRSYEFNKWLKETGYIK